jgi:hypothetical protein
MGNKLFGVNISKLVHKNMSKGLLAATLTKKSSGERTSGSLTSGKAKTDSTHECKGFVDTYSDRELQDAKNIQASDRKILIIGDSITPAAVPEKGDEITILGRTYRIVGPVMSDPAAATYIIQGR